jgi:hypothetical protein
MRTIVVNLFSGPGAGKSMFQAGLYWELKWKGVNADVFDKQHHRG